MENYIPKEISWLYFNERVLQEAANPDVPIFERVKFLGIYSNNLDEFFRVRVAILKRFAKISDKGKLLLGYNAKQVLEDIRSLVLAQRLQFDMVYKDILKELNSKNIFLINHSNLNPDQSEFLLDYFRKNIKYHLSPVMLSQTKSFPELKDEVQYFVLSLRNKDKKTEEFAVLEIPQKNLPRFIQLPNIGTKMFFVFLDDIIRLGLFDVFQFSDYQQIEAFSIKLTKDAELDISDDISESYLQNVAKSLKKRKEGNPVSVVYDKDLPDKILKSIFTSLKIKKNDAIIPGGKYHNLKDLLKFPFPSLENSLYKPDLTIQHSVFNSSKSVFEAIKKQDILLYFPFHSFDNVLRLLQEAALDPKVTTIKCTIYRLAKNSALINTLINAAKNGKSVTVVIELQARFDEEANIYWSNRLAEEGVKVVNGVNGLKVHAKIIQISRMENGQITNYAAVSTGNFNENTARLYTDLMILTASKKIANEVPKVYNMLEKSYKRESFSHLILSPFSLRIKLVKLIQTEIENAQKGKPAKILIKINNLVSPQIVKLLYQAASEGVEVKLMVRGMLSLVSGKAGLSDTIQSKAIIDKYLEHTRFFIFSNNNNPKVFISSADWMDRNLDRRIEVTCPVYDQEIKNILQKSFEMYWNDNQKNRTLDFNDFNKIPISDKAPFNAQSEMFLYLNSLTHKKTT